MLPFPASINVSSDSCDADCNAVALAPAEGLKELLPSAIIILLHTALHRNAKALRQKNELVR